MINEIKVVVELEDDLNTLKGGLNHECKWIIHGDDNSRPYSVCSGGNIVLAKGTRYTLKDKDDMIGLVYVHHDQKWHEFCRSEKVMTQIRHLYRVTMNDDGNHFFVVAEDMGQAAHVAEAQRKAWDCSSQAKTVSVTLVAWGYPHKPESYIGLEKAPWFITAEEEIDVNEIEEARHEPI